MDNKAAEREKIKSEWCDIIQAFIVELERLRSEKKDTTAVCAKLERALEEFRSFRQGTTGERDSATGNTP